MEGQSGGFRKFLGTRAGKWTIGVVVIFVLYLIGNNSLKDTQDQINANTVSTQTTNTVSLAQHKVIPGVVQGTTRRVTVIVQPNVTESEVTGINNDLIARYKGNLTHLNIDFFDDEAVSKDYFQKVINASESEGDAMFAHYRAAYTFNNTSGLHQLQWNMNGDWETIKNY